MGLGLLIQALPDTIRVTEAIARPAGWLAVVFFGGRAVVALANLIRRPQLIFSPAGLEMRQWPKDVTVRWTDMRDVFALRGRKKSLAAWSLFDDGAERGLGTAIHRVFGCDGLVSDVWSLSPQEILHLMKDWHGRFGRPAGSA